MVNATNDEVLNSNWLQKDVLPDITAMSKLYCLLLSIFLGALYFVLTKMVTGILGLHFTTSHIIMSKNFFDTDSARV